MVRTRQTRIENRLDKVETVAALAVAVVMTAAAVVLPFIMLSAN